MKRMKGKMIFVMIVMAIMLCCSMGVAADTVDPADTVNVTAYADVQAEGAFAVAYQMVRVNSYLAESYGYTDQVDYKEDVSALDVLVKLHELKYGSAFTATTCSDYLTLAGTGIAKAFGEVTYSWSVLLNGEFAHTDEVDTQYGGYKQLALSETPIDYGDLLEIVKYQDLTDWSDVITWVLDEDGDYTQSFVAVEGDALPVTVKSLSPMYANYGQSEIQDNYLTDFSGVQLGIMDKDGSLTAIDGAVTDADGEAELTFDTAGTYHVVAYLPASSSTKAFMAVFDVKVYKEIDASVFSDVEDDWYYDAVDFVAQANLMLGTSPTTFSPDTKLTRAMFATILYRMTGEPNSTVASPFKDVADGKWYSDAVVWAYAMGITNGTTPTTFAPDNVLTRQDMATMFARYAVITGATLPDSSDVVRYKDDSEIADYASDAVYALTKTDVLHGVGGDKFAPKEVATRAQIAQMLYNLMQPK